MKTLEDIRAEIIKQLENNGVIKDADQIGSNISILIDIIAYQKYNISFDIRNSIKETLLPTTTDKKNAIMFAQDILGYTIERAGSSYAKIKVKPKSTLGDGVTVAIPIGTQFTSDNGDVYYTKKGYSISNTLEDIEIFEGIIIDKTIDASLSHTITSPTDYILIPYKDIENSSISVTKNGTRMTKVDRLLSLKKDFTYIEENDANTGWVKIKFSYVGYGVVLEDGDVVDISFVVTKGSSGNGATEFSLKSTLVDSDGNDVELDISFSGTSSRGTDVESLESIKSNAPKRYNTGAVTVSKSDYESILEEMSSVEFGSAWGGEEEFPQQLGHINIATTPANKGINSIAPVDMVPILEELDTRKVVATLKNVVAPQWIYMDIEVQFLGQLNNNNLTQKQDEVEEVIKQFFAEQLNGFRKIFFSSTLTRKIDALFVNENQATAIVNLKPKLLLNPLKDSYKRPTENFIRTYLPNSLTRYKMVHKDDINNIVDVPSSNSELSDLLNNGWKVYHSRDNAIEINFKGDVLGKTFSSEPADLNMMPDDSPNLFNMGYYADIPGVEYNQDGLDKVILYDGSTIGRFFNMTSCLELDKTKLDEMITNQTDLKFIELEYTPHFNVIGVNNSVFKLDTISFV